MKTSELIEQRAAIVARMSEAHGKDDQTAFDAAKADLDAHDAKLTRARAIDDAERREAGETLHGDAAPEIRAQSISETLRYAIGAPCDRAKVEREQAFLEERAGTKAQGIYIATELFEQRATQTTATSAAITPVNYRPEMFTSALVNQTIVATLGATVLTGLTGNVVIPRETGSPAVGWAAEDAAIPYGNATFDSITLTPRHVGAITELSRQLLMQSSPSADALVRQMLSRNIAIEIDRAAIDGSGASAQPTGLLNIAGIPSVAFDTDLFTTAANMIGALDTANVGASRAFVSTNGVKAVAAKSKDGQGRPLGIPTIFHNERVEFSNQVPNTLNPGGNKHGLVYGDWTDLLIGVWSQLDILVNPYAQNAYEKGNVLVRAMATVDIAARRTASFVKATGVAA